MMNIKQVEKLTGISSQNIRFYEKSGLIHPKRNEENGYREYNEEDIRLLKPVKMFRMLDMPIEQIKLMLCETDELDNLLGKQEKVLEKKLANTKCAIDLCENLRKTHKTIADIDVDSYLNQMEKAPGKYFDKWISDYKDAAAACVLAGSIGNAITHLSGRNSIIKNTVFYHGRCYYSDSYVGVMCCDVYSQLFLLLELQ